MMSLLSLPDELIHQCSFHVVAHEPLGLPHALIPLALICRAFNLVVSSHAFKARIYRFKFDVGAVTRRLFVPRDSDLADELQRCCNVLKEIRSGEVTESGEDPVVDDTLISAYLLMLSNDGKNYAQLEHAGLDAYVDKFIMTRLWEGSETNHGWPLDNFSNSAALWLMWMTLTKRKLAAQSQQTRDNLTRDILPYVVLPFRYASASVPPNHFNLPLDSQNRYHQSPLIFNTGPTSYPIYLSDDAIYDTPYVNARIRISQPLITIAAKLIFVAMKEMNPVTVPPHLPEAPGPGVVGLTQQDVREVCNSPCARLCRVVIWNWDTGSPNRVGGEDGDTNEIDEGWEESKNWDTEWWRRLLCLSHYGKRPKYPPGNVFNLGSMRGRWHGKKFDPTLRFLALINHPNIPYPGIPDETNPDHFTETSIGLSLNRLYLDMQEHHKICECAQGSNISESHPYVAPTFIPERATASTSSSPPMTVPIGPQSGRCGVVPIPAPLVFEERREAFQNQGEQEDDETSDALELSLPAPVFSMVDCSMSNAWFPGHLGGVSFSKIPFSVTGDGMREKIVCAVDFQTPDINSVLFQPEESECLSLGGQRRQQQYGQGKMNAFVYETYDPEKMSMHRGLNDSKPDGGNSFISASSSNDYPVDDPHKCQRCLQREALIRIERKKAEHRSKVILDRGLRSYGRGDNNWHHHEDMDMDEDEDGDEDEEMEEGEDDEDDDDDEMRDVDVDELGIDMDGIIAQSLSFSTDAASSIATDDASTSSSQFVSYGDDDEEYLDVDGCRKVYDKCRIGVECNGVADVLLSGETVRRIEILNDCRLYGRVRPWDGLIGLVQSVSTGNNTVTNVFIFGYIVGEDNFVGEWRLAATNPLVRTWGGAFVMSRKIAGGAR